MIRNPSGICVGGGLPQGLGTIGRDCAARHTSIDVGQGAIEEMGICLGTVAIQTDFVACDGGTGFTRMKLLHQKSKALFVDLDEMKDASVARRLEPCTFMLQSKKANRTGGYRRQGEKPEVFASLLDRKRYGMGYVPKPKNKARKKKMH
jgi:hypothetical protein